MKTTVFFLLLFGTSLCFSQVVFSEAFDEADDAITGSDGIGPVTWNTICPGSAALTDYFKVVSGKLEARDTNGPGAEWETGTIDISSCTGVSISFEMDNASTMEACASCPGLTGTGCIDWVKLEYNLDGGGWTDVAGTTCALTEAPGDMIQIGNIAAGPITYTSPCINMGTTLEIRISCMCWADAEMWIFDDITVSCFDCVLPVEVIDFKATQYQSNTVVSWSTLNERANDYFTIERSNDGVNYDFLGKINGAGNSTSEIDYSIEDNTVTSSNIVYYRLNQFDTDGKQAFQETISIATNSPVANIFFDNEKIHYAIAQSNNKKFNLAIYDLNGKLVHISEIDQFGNIPWNKSGFYIVEIPEIDFRQKLVTTPK